MSTYVPDCWVVLKMKDNEQKTTLYKVLASWYGGYAGSDSWKLNSGITNINIDGENFLFSGYSGSVYKCHKDCYGMSLYTSDILANFLKQAEDSEGTFTIELLKDNIDFLKLI